MDGKMLKLHKMILNAWNCTVGYLDLLQLTWYLKYKNWIEEKEYEQLLDKDTIKTEDYESWEDLK